MSLALEEQRAEAEETLTVLAAAKAAQEDVGVALTAALLAQDLAEGDLAAAREALDAAIDENADRGEIEAQLAAALLAKEALGAEVLSTQLALTETEQTRADLELRIVQSEEALGEMRLTTQSLEAQLASALAERDAISAQLAEAQDLRAALEAEIIAARVAADQAGQGQVDLQAQLAAALAVGDAAQSEMELAQLAERAALDEVARLQNELSAAQNVAAGNDDLRAQLASALAAQLAAQRAAEAEQLSAQEERAALLAAANEALSEEEAISAESRRELAVLNEQVAELRSQIGHLQTWLDLAETEDAANNVQITELGSQLNTALARAASEQRRRAELEAAERLRLEQEVKELADYESSFLRQLRGLLGDQEGIRIEGDRFVFASEVLFAQGSADLSSAGEAEIAKVAGILRQVGSEIPPEINWVIRVDGHTDDVPLSGFGEFSNNWELSQARALSVVLYMVNFLGIPPNRLAANGFGQYQPIDPASTEEARAQNRRIELKFTER
jgi:chemotaxis protein MotB